MGAFFSGKLPGLKKLSYPLDFYLKLHGKRLLGSHKTIRGLLSGMIVGVSIVWLESICYRQFSFIRQHVLLNYTTINPLIFGSLAGGGALIGDAVKSFFKRRMDIAPGKSWFPFDQMDYILGGIAFTSLYSRLSFWHYMVLFVVWFLLHPLTTSVGFVLRLREEAL